MMNLTHVALSVCVTSIALSTADPVTLGISALASQLPDVDTSKSVVGRVLFPISNYLEARYPHRSITHSFLATGAIALLTLPLVILNSSYWLALTLGYFCGWFGDVFTKSGVTAFYPHQARLVIPGNPRLRLATGSSNEYLVLVAIAIACLISINISSSGGILRAFNQALAMPSGAVEITNEEINRHILIAQVKGRNALTQAPVVGNYEIVKSLTDTDLLVTDRSGKLYRIGSSQEVQIATNSVRTERGRAIATKSMELRLDGDDLGASIASIPAAGRIYISGTLNLEDAEDLVLDTSPEQFNPITLQPIGNGLAVARIESATLNDLQALKDYPATGSLVVRIIDVRS
jgi:inner membrane protein